MDEPIRYKIPVMLLWMQFTGSKIKRSQCVAVELKQSAYSALVGQVSPFLKEYIST